MTTATTLSDVRAALIQRGYPDDQVDAMLDLAGRMMLEGSLASQDDINALRDELGLFENDVAERFAELCTEMHERFAELHAGIDGDAYERERRVIKWVEGAVIAGIAVNVAVFSIAIAVVALLLR